jgi:hypothetical protein
MPVSLPALETNNDESTKTSLVSSKHTLSQLKANSTADEEDEFRDDNLLSFSRELDAVVADAEVQRERSTPSKRLDVFTRPLSPNWQQTLVMREFPAQHVFRMYSAERDSLCTRGTKHDNAKCVKLQCYGYEQISNCKELIKRTNKFERDYNAAIIHYNAAKSRVLRYAGIVRDLRTNEFKRRTQRDRWIARFGHPDTFGPLVVERSNIAPASCCTPSPAKAATNDSTNQSCVKQGSKRKSSTEPQKQLTAKSLSFDLKESNGSNTSDGTN